MITASRNLQGWLTLNCCRGDTFPMRSTVGTSQVRTYKQWINVSMRILETYGKLKPSLLGGVSRSKVDGVDGNYRTAVSVRIGYDTCFIEAKL